MAIKTVSTLFLGLLIPGKIARSLCSCHICSAGDDSQALIWDLTNVPNPVEDPILAYGAEGEISMLQWSVAHTDWVAIVFDKKLQILRV